MPKRGSNEYLEMKTKHREVKREVKEAEKDQRMTPPFLTTLLLSSSVPQTYALYVMIWNDPLSDIFFYTFDYAYGWIALLTTMEGAAG